MILSITTTTTTTTIIIIIVITIIITIIIIIMAKANTCLAAAPSNGDSCKIRKSWIDTIFKFLICSQFLELEKPIQSLKG